MTIDSSAFDAKVYYEQLITTASLPALLKRENELLTGDDHTSIRLEVRPSEIRDRCRD